MYPSINPFVEAPKPALAFLHFHQIIPFSKRDDFAFFKKAFTKVQSNSPVALAIIFPLQCVFHLEMKTEAAFVKLSNRSGRRDLAGVGMR